MEDYGWGYQKRQKNARQFSFELCRAIAAVIVLYIAASACFCFLYAIGEMDFVPLWLRWPMIALFYFFKGLSAIKG